MLFLHFNDNNLKLWQTWFILYNFSMCKNGFRHKFNVYTQKKTVFVYFAIFKYEFQSCLFKLLHFISGECVKDLCQYHILSFFSPFVLFLSNNCLYREASGQTWLFKLIVPELSDPMPLSIHVYEVTVSQTREHPSSRIFIWLSCLLEENYTKLCVLAMFLQEKDILGLSVYCPCALECHIIMMRSFSTCSPLWILLAAALRLLSAV